MIYNKSGHPIEVKKISIRIWGVRDEIEAAIGRRMKECEAAAIPLYIEDIKKFYNIDYQSPDNVLRLASAPDDEMTSLMESISEDVAAEDVAAEDAGEENQTLSEAEEIIAKQALEGLETKKPNPILQRPYQRQAPDLDKVSYGFILLSDINMQTMMSFMKGKFLHGQSVVVEFLIPQQFIMTADVTYCNHYAMKSRIISSSKPDYRIQCKFRFALQGERDNLRNFLRSIEPDLKPAKKKEPKADEEDSFGI